jgi:hypothetical protein
LPEVEARDVREDVFVRPARSFLGLKTRSPGFLLGQAGLLVDVVGEHVGHGVVADDVDVALYEGLREREKQEEKERRTNVVGRAVGIRREVLRCDIRVSEEMREEEVANAARRR